MKPTVFRYLAALLAVPLILSACNAGTATPDPNIVIATSVAQTVEARDTAQAAQIPPTVTPAPTLADTPTPRPAVTPPTSTPQPLDSNGKPCYKAIFVEDVTIPDGMLVAPGSTFTKKWRVINDGNCAWDRNYSLMLASGDAMGTVTKFPLTEVISPGATAIIAVDLTAPTVNGIYTGYWRIATPFGGSFGVGLQDQSLIVEINVTDKPNRDEGVSGVDVGLFKRTPGKGCSSNGAVYTFSATITANSDVNVTYHWVRHPDDGSKPEGGRLRFSAAGSQTVTFTWSFQREAIQGIDRWVALVIDTPTSLTSQRIHFMFTCDE